MASPRNYTNALFGFDLNGKLQGMLKKATTPELSGDKHDMKSGVDHITKKSIANIAWGEGGISVAASMGGELQKWIQMSFDHAGTKAYYDGAILSANFDGIEMRRVNFSQALITECSFSNLDAASKDAMYCDIKFKPEGVRHLKGSGKSVLSGLGMRHKDFMCANFRVEVAGLDVSTVQKVELPKFTQKTSVDAVGHLRENAILAHSLELSDIKFTVGSGPDGKVEDAWLAAAEKWFISGETLEEHHITIAVHLLLPDMKTEIGSITYDGCGWLKVKTSDLERSDKPSTFDATFYVETCKLALAHQDPA